MWLQWTGARRAAPLVIEVAPPGNIAVGIVSWGLAPWLPAGSVVQVPTGGEQADRRACGRAAACYK